ncbi:MAG: YkgJ family cysteine cluster protein [Desulfobacteraceae bacterium]|nr:YkgJ family cysteine cluster protein [Desulfobacteraceae bacterium]
MEKKTRQLKRIYSSFEKETKGYRDKQACEKGCAYCCSEAGSIDITTIEGLQIRNTMKNFPKPRQKALTKIFQKEIKKREKGINVPCPFLMRSKACMIYEVRPLSCRRIYSYHTCTKEKPPEISRQVMKIADQSIKKLQQLDDTGYSGHLSYILYMLSTPAFYQTYINGDFKPEEIMVFGKSHKIIINKMMI